MMGALHTMAVSDSAAQATLASWQQTSPTWDDIMKLIKKLGGKGRYAQELASTNLVAPAHIDLALTYLLSK